MKKSLGLLLLAPFALFGQNLPELIELSKNNKLIDVSQQTLESTKSAYESKKGSYLPSATLSATHQRASNEEKSGSPDNTTVLSGTLSYTIYDGGAKGNTYDYYEYSIQGDNQNLTNTKNQIALQVTTYYYNYLSLVSQKEAKEKEIEQLNAQQKRLERFLEAGTTTDDEVQKIISRVQSANVALHEIELNIQTILHNLEYTVGNPVSITKGSKLNEYISKEEILRSDIKALEYDMKAQLYNARSQESGNYPTLKITDTYSQNDLNYEKSNNSKDYSENVIALSLSWNIFDFGATSKSYEAAYKQYLALKSQYEYEKNRASVDLRLAKKAFDIAKLKISSARAGLKAADSAYESIKAKYQNGLVDNVSFLESLSEKYDAQSALQTALYDFEIKKANVIYHSGKNIEEYVQ